MKAWAVVKTFKDGNKEGVLFTNEEDANLAFLGCEQGSTLACEWTRMYGGSEGCPESVDECEKDFYDDFEEHENVEITEIDI